MAARLGSLDGEPKSSGVESNGGAGWVAGARAGMRLSGDPGSGAETAATGDDAGVREDSPSRAATAGDAKPAGARRRRSSAGPRGRRP